MTMSSAPRRLRKRSQGAALLAAMLTVTLVATFAAAAMWQQWGNIFKPLSFFKRWGRPITIQAFCT